MYARSRFNAFGPGGATPITFGVLIAVAILYVLTLTGVGAALEPWLRFIPAAFPQNFWTILTWPLIEPSDPIGALFTMLWFYYMASSLERAWGSRDFGVILSMLSITLALLGWIGYIGLHLTPQVQGLSLLTGPLMVAWAVVNRRETMLIWFVPIPAFVILWLGVAETWYFGGIGLHGLCLVPACGLMYWYVTQGRYGDSGFRPAKVVLRTPFQDRHGSGLRLEDFDRTPATQRRPVALDEAERPRGFSILRWWRDRQEKKRLEEIFRRSGFTDDDERR